MAHRQNVLQPCTLCASQENAPKRICFCKVDWAAHEAKVGAEYDARRAALQARAGINGTTGRGVLQAEGDRYGQGISPTSLGRASGGGGGGGVRGGWEVDGGVSGGGGEGEDGEASKSTPWRSREKQVCVCVKKSVASLEWSAQALAVIGY